MRIVFAHLAGLLLAASLITSCVTTPHAAQDPPGDVLTLKDGWNIQSSAKVISAGGTISKAGFNTPGWYAATVPTTVLSALVKNGIYKDIYFNKNLGNVDATQFNTPWWYRTEFSVTAAQAAQDAELVFEGINYRAEIWLNGNKITSADQTYGAFRVFKFHVNGLLKQGTNALALKITKPQPGEFTMGFVDWNPLPPDTNMGLFRPVKVHFFKNVCVKQLFVKSKIDHATWSKADLTVDATLINYSKQAVQATVKCQIGSITVSEPVMLKPGQTLAYEMSPAKHPELKLANAQLWWPWEMGKPYLYNLQMTVQVAGTDVDAASIDFGIREVADYKTAEGYRGYMVNGKKFLLRGGGWVDDLLLDEDPARVEAQVAYARGLNLNTIRLEGFWGSSQALYDLADKYGMLIMVGWSCQWEWPEYLGAKTDDKGGFITEAQMDFATQYLHDQVLWLRHHPSILMWVLGSDTYPRAALEQKYDALLAQIDPTRPKLISCADKTSTISGNSGVKMKGPYDYVTPNYWYLDTENGGAYGFNTETGPGPQPPPLESLKKFITPDKLWPVGDSWNYHCGRFSFPNINRYLNAYNNRYGAAKSVDEFAFKSQAANYEAIRPMFEAFACNLPHTTGIVQWMLNGAWPKLYWQLYDYYLMPGGAYFGAKIGAAPISIVYNYGDGGVYLTNQGIDAPATLKASVTVYDLNSKKIYTNSVKSSAPAYGSKKLFDLSQLKPSTPVYFAELVLADTTGIKLMDNFYWLSTKADVLDEGKTQWFVTPNKSFADFTALSKLPKATVIAQTRIKPIGGGAQAIVTLTNTSDKLAFFIEMRMTGAKSGQTLLPVLWNDNYISLGPGVSKTFYAQIPQIPAGETPVLKAQGWNVNFATN